ncbi:hypothetical protein NQ317_013460 [Molorchus minor]|uniref:Short-chain dehydrogenase n=1 Tax=Molorchus minor TaxID=1323400 RepID=A0ABQ9J6A4_9CUCU|nr:hypothetical protein NQ317_013460 [Molorchus minor]
MTGFELLDSEQNSINDKSRQRTKDIAFNRAYLTKVLDLHEKERRPAMQESTSVTASLFYSVFMINIKATIHVSKLVIKAERKAPGSIVNISSQASLAGLLHHTVYCATKGAVDAFTRAAALEYGPYNIRVNAVNPTVIMTDKGRLGMVGFKNCKPMLEKFH